MRSAIDRDGLLAALVLSPATYSRNRFYELYDDPEVRRVRRRASQIRSVVRHVTRASEAEPADAVSVAAAPGDRVELTYEVPALGLKRTVLLERIELSLVRFAVARSGRPVAALPADEGDRASVEAALARLAPEINPAPADARG